MLAILYRRLDRIRLVRRYPSPAAQIKFNATLSSAYALAGNDELDKKSDTHSTLFTKNYKGKDWETGIRFRFFSVQGKPAIAVDCTPSQLADEDWFDFLALMVSMFDFGPQEVWKEFKLAKLEVAMDLRKPFGDVICIAPGFTSWDPSYFEKGSLYLGARYGRRHHCVYDKRKQLKEAKKFDPGYDLTRIEARHRGLGKSLGDLHTLTDPFGRLVVITRARLGRLLDSHPQDAKLHAFAAPILQGAVAQDEYLHLEKYQRKRILKLLRPHSLNLNGKVENWQKWVAMTQADLKARFFSAH